MEQTRERSKHGKRIDFPFDCGLTGAAASFLDARLRSTRAVYRRFRRGAHSRGTTSQVSGKSRAGLLPDEGGM